MEVEMPAMVAWGVGGCRGVAGVVGAEATGWENGWVEAVTRSKTERKKSRNDEWN